VGTSWQRVGMELLGISLATAACPWEARCTSRRAFGRAATQILVGGGAYFGERTAARPRVCSRRGFGGEVAWQHLQL